MNIGEEYNTGDEDIVELDEMENIQTPLLDLLKSVHEQKEIDEDGL